MAGTTTKQERKVVHLYLKKDDSHHYFGSVANMYEFYSAEDLGIAYSTMRLFAPSPDKTYENEKCIVRVGRLLSKPMNTSLS